LGRHAGDRRLIVAGEGTSTGPLTTLQDLGRTWASVAALVVAGLYVLGFIALRFHLQVLGVETESSVIDVSYLTAGGRVVLWLMLLGIPVGLPILLLHRLCIPGIRPGNTTDAFFAFILAILVLLFLFALTPADVLRHPAGAQGWIAQQGLLVLGEAQPGQNYLAVVAAFAAMAAELLAIIFVAGRWRRTGRLDPLLGFLALIAVAGVVALVGLQGVYFIPKHVEQLTPVPTALSGRARQVWLVYRGTGKATLFYCSDTGERVLTTLPVNDIDGFAAAAPQPIGKLMGADACSKKASPS
jgi:hypothetical protein